MPHATGSHLAAELYHGGWSLGQCQYDAWIGHVNLRDGGGIVGQGQLQALEVEMFSKLLITLNKFDSTFQTLATKPLSVALPKQEQDDSFDQVMVDATREALINSTGIILANPFRIIAIRQIAGLADGSSKSVLVSKVMHVNKGQS